MTSPDADYTRTQAFTTDGPVQIDVQLTTGSLTVELAEETGEDAVQVDIRHDPASGPPWTQGLSSALSWVHEQFGDQFDTDLSGSASAAVEQTQVDMVGSRLSVQAPKALPLRHLPLAVTVRAPAGSQIDVRAASARVGVTGTTAGINVHTSAGDVTLDRVERPLHVRTGSGDVAVSAVNATTSIVTGSGSIRIGSAEGEVSIRTASGDIAVADAVAGSLSAKTGSGQIRVGLHAGVLAEVHLSSATGHASSDLDVSYDPPEETAQLRVRARSGSGDVAVTATED